jgi:hypothetical protein
VKLSITHKSRSTDFRSKSDISEASKATPDNDDSRWRIAGSGQIACWASQAGSQELLHSWDNAVQSAPREHNQQS